MKGRFHMNWRTIGRHLLGYVVGFGVFVVGIPYGLCEIADKLDRHASLGLLSDPRVRLPLALLIGGVGAAFLLWSNLYLLLVGKGGPADAFGVAVSPRSRQLVTTGPYRYTRNPMVFGALSLYLALALYLSSATDLALVALLLACAPAYLRRVEETRLLTDFGEAFEQYRKEVPMLLPIPRKKSPR